MSTNKYTKWSKLEIGRSFIQNRTFLSCAGQHSSTKHDTIHINIKLLYTQYVQ